jgi:hypothetical protein
MLEEIEQALYCIRVALLGEVTNTLRAITFSIQKDPLTLTINYYYTGHQDEDYLEDLSCISTEATAYFGSDQEQSFIQLNTPNLLPDNSYYAYLRKEDTLPSFNRINFSYSRFITANILNTVGEALLGRVTSELMYIYADIRNEGKMLYLRFYHFKPISDETKKLWQTAIDETSAAFRHFPHKVDSKIIQTAFIPRETDATDATDDGRCVFERKGVHSDFFESP